MALSLPSLIYASSADYARLTGGFVYNSRLVQELSVLGWDIDGLELPAGFPNPDDGARAVASRQVSEIADGRIVLLDQICLSPLADIADREKRRLRWAMIFHHPMALEEGLTTDEVRRRAGNERIALSASHLVITTSQATARRLESDYAVPLDRIVTAEPGIQRVRHSGSVRAPINGRILMLALGAVVPRKGYELMIAALSRLADLPWRLSIVGDTERAPGYVAALRQQIDDAGLRGRVRLTGGLSPSQLDRHWRRAHVFLASSHHEGYGMAVAEALARGLPTVTTDAGTIGQWIEPDAAIILHDRSANAFASALRPVLMDAALRCAMSGKALDLARRLPTWQATAKRVHERLLARMAPPP